VSSAPFIFFLLEVEFSNKNSSSKALLPIEAYTRLGLPLFGLPLFATSTIAGQRLTKFWNNWDHQT
jgi:hypothetical protein